MASFEDSFHLIQNTKNLKFKKEVGIDYIHKKLGSKPNYTQVDKSDSVQVYPNFWLDSYVHSYIDP